jgi:hypothetical protein
MSSEPRQTGTESPGKFRHDCRVPGQMRRIDKLQLNIGRPNVPESHEIVEIRGVADEKASVVPSWLDGIMAAHQISR